MTHVHYSLSVFSPVALPSHSFSLPQLKEARQHRSHRVLGSLHTGWLIKSKSTVRAFGGRFYDRRFFVLDSVRRCLKYYKVLIERLANGDSARVFYHSFAVPCECKYLY